MNKADLKKKWSKYCDTDKLVDDMMEVLTKYNHRNSEHGVCVVLDKYFTNKEPLIKLFMTSNHYHGDMRIVVNRDFERVVDSNEVYEFCSHFSKDVNADKILLQFKDEDGKTVTDYLKTGHTKVNVKDVVLKNVVNANKARIDQFAVRDDGGPTATSSANRKGFENCVGYFKYHKFPKIVETNNNYAVELVKGTKTSRAFNKVCTHYGIDKSPKYNKLFAKYADLVSDNVRHLYFVISLNPLDYLTMSIGKSWTSCHSIVSTNGNGGMASGGCVSYMLDNVSIITFVVEDLNTPLHKAGKLYRQMFYYRDNVFIQSRLYPQGNDGAVNLYEQFREYMQDEFVEPLGVKEDKWEHRTNRDESQVVTRHSQNIGYHYPDAGGNYSCGIFYPAEKKNNAIAMRNRKMTIGNTSYCFYCGKEQTESRRRLSHVSCSI